jgi:hypothetical protein
MKMAMRGMITPECLTLSKHKAVGPWCVLVWMCLAWASACSPPWEVGLGDECETLDPHRDTSCSEGLCVQGICRAYAGSREPCGAHEQCSNEGEVCAPGDLSQPNDTTCLPPLNEGDPCLPDRNICDQRQDLLCHKGECTAPRRLGESCRIKFPSGPPSCHDRLICRPEGVNDFPLDSEAFKVLDRDTGVCAQPIQEGEACHTELGVECASGFGCWSHTCKP